MTTGVLLTVFMISFAIVSLKENEPRAARRAFLVALLLPLPYLALGISGILWQSTPAMLTLVSALLLALTFGTGLALLLPIGNRLIAEKDTPHNRIDERDIMFSRNLLQVGTERYKAYYAANPDKKKCPGSDEDPIPKTWVAGSLISLSLSHRPTYAHGLDLAIRECAPDPLERSELIPVKPP